MTHSEAPPAWAMEKAREVVSRFMISSYYSEYKSTVAIARALADERERAAKIADALPGWQQPRDVALAIRGE